MQRIDADRLGDVLELLKAEIGGSEIEPAFDLPIRLLGQTDRAGCANALQPRRDVDPVAHEVAVSLFNHVAQMDADAKLNPPVGRDACIALDHAGLHFDRAARRVDHATEFSDEPVPGALDNSAVVDSDRRLDQITAQRAQPRQRALLVGAREPAITDDIGDQDRHNFPGLAHSSGSPALRRPS